MAGGQERILRRRIRSVQSTKKITRAHGAHRGEPHRQGPGRGRGGAALQRADHRGRPRPRRRAGAAVDSPLLTPRPEIRRVAFVVIAADRGLCGAYNSSVIRDGGARRCRREVARGRDYALIVVGRKAESYFRYRDYRIDAVVHRLQRPARATRTPARSARRSTARVRGRRDRRGRSSSTPAFHSAGSQERRPPDADAARARRDRRPPTGGRRRRRSPRRTSSSRRPRASSTGSCRATSRLAGLRRAARRGRVGARRPPAGDEGRHRQRRRPHHQPDPGHEPGPPGRHHHRDHGDRRPAPRPSAQGEHGTDDLSDTIEGRDADLFATHATDA